MIRGRLISVDGRSRPYVLAHIAIPSQGVSDNVELLVDTGADGTLLSPSDAAALRLDLAQLPPGPPSTGVGGRVPTRYAQANLTLDTFSYHCRCVSSRRGLARNSKNSPAFPRCWGETSLPTLPCSSRNAPTACCF